MASKTHAQNLAQLQAVENQLRAEQKEDADVEARIRALADAHMQAAASAASSQHDQPRQEFAQPQYSQPTYEQPREPAHYSAPPPAPSQYDAPRHSDVQQQQRSPSGSPGSQQRSPSGSTRLTGAAAGGAAVPSKVVYRSPMYRSASPSRKVGSDAVRISNFSRAPRFKTKNGWVPGPGHYPVHATTSVFSPTTVREAPDLTGTQGHTWEEYQQYVRGGSSQALVQQDDVRSRAAYQDATLAASSSPGNNTERKLRSELQGLQRSLSQTQGQSAQAQHQLYAEIESLKARLARKSKAYTALGQKVRSWRDNFGRLQASTARLQTALDASIPNVPGDDPLYPLLREVNSRAREVGEHVSNLAPFVHDTAGAVDKSEGIDSPAAAKKAPRDSPSQEARRREVEAALAARGIRPGDVASFAASAQRNAVQQEADDAEKARTAARRAEVAAVFGESANAGGHFSIRAGFSPVTGKAASKESAAALGTTSAARARDLATAVSPSVERRARAMARAREQAAAAQGGAASHVPKDASVRRFGVGEVTVQGRAALREEAKAAAAKLSDEERLAQIFQYYASFGARLEEHPQMKAPQYLKLLRDAGVLEGSRVTSSDVDIVFVRAAKAQMDAAKRAGHASPPGGGVVTTSTRLTFQGFVMVLMMTATLRYGDVDKLTASHVSRTAVIDSVSQAEQQECLRSLLRDCILPVHAQLLKDPVFAQDVLGVGDSETKRRFEADFMSDEVIAWFQGHKAAMESIFYRYSMGSTSAAGAGSWQAVRETHKFLTRAQFLAFANDYKLSAMVNRTDLANIFKEANRGLAHDEASDQLTYSEFLEVLGLIAFNLFGGAERQGDVMTQGMVAKLELLFFRLHEQGCTFQANQEESTFIRSVINAVKRRLGGFGGEADKQAQAKTAPVAAQLSRAQDMLLQALK